MPKCRECRYLIGKRRSVGIECMQTDNQKKWNALEEENIKAGKFYPKVVARFKQPSTKACRRFEVKEK